MKTLNFRTFLAAMALASPFLTGCIGSIRDTTTSRTATEILLISTAAERAVGQYDAEPIKGKRVFIDDSRFDSVDKPYVLSSLRDHLAGSGVTITTNNKPVSADATGADFVLELRNATLGIWDGDFVLGIPSIPISAQGFPPALLPPLYAFRRLSAQGFAKFQFWLYDPANMKFIGRSKDLWGHSYYNQWWWFGVGPFDGSNDVYPDFDVIPSIGDDDDDDGDGE